VLGSFPSVRSLAKGEYYGNERNHFWELFGLSLGAPLPADYQGRLATLVDSGLALWDIIGSCEREGSLDRDIRGIVPNPVLAYVASMPSLERIALNGGLAAESFRRHVAPELSKAVFAIGKEIEWRPGAQIGRVIIVARLPSTSPIPTKDFRTAGDKAIPWKNFLEPLYGY
jgi:hypoxanthine-DNA glycosylase